jgi:hypothetical protein
MYGLHASRITGSSRSCGSPRTWFDRPEEMAGSLSDRFKAEIEQF